ncbi:DNA topoisomerase IB [Amycolatopsis xylanica]|uniref:DNA topoisomerase n=1 Tax=Amycolatopsis xylanica TaxID=589385 RepID=A0A1H3H375_9PSEU|nr:DNA topoisomerase IB [Amycolatopsis xylanica]
MLTGAGLKRVRRGRGFSYLTEDGTPLDDPEVRDRITALVIPPAWRDVWICPYANGHIQAVGTDDAGRRQYLYHPDWRRKRDEEKHDRVLTMARRLPEWREDVADGLAERGLGCRRVLAAALFMLDRGIFRTGGEEYAEENGTHGVATLLREHTTVRGNEVRFEYPAKGGIMRVVSITEKALASVVKSLLRSHSGSDRLLVYRERDGWHEVHAQDINNRFKELAGDDCSAKDLRTWNATVLAAVAFAAAPEPTSKTARKRAEAAVMREVSEALGNTPAVCRASYVDPRVVEAYRDGRTIAAAVKRVRRVDDDESRHAIERAVIRLLSSRTG